MVAQINWGRDRASQYHFYEFEDGVALFLEGENSISLINSFAAYLLRKFDNSSHSFQELLDLIQVDYPDEPIETLGQLLDSTLAGLSQSGILIRTRW